MEQLQPESQPLPPPSVYNTEVKTLTPELKEWLVVPHVPPDERETQKALASDPVAMFYGLDPLTTKHDGSISLSPEDLNDAPSPTPNAALSAASRAALIDSDVRTDGSAFNRQPISVLYDGQIAKANALMAKSLKKVTLALIDRAVGCTAQKIDRHTGEPIVYDVVPDVGAIKLVMDRILGPVVKEVVIDPAQMETLKGSTQVHLYLPDNHRDTPVSANAFAGSQSAMPRVPHAPIIHESLIDDLAVTLAAEFIPVSRETELASSAAPTVAEDPCYAGS
jgi:hypothetical protein